MKRDLNKKKKTIIINLIFTNSRLFQIELKDIRRVAVVKKSSQLLIMATEEHPVGEKFHSFEEFESKLKKLYQDSKFVQLYRRSSAKIGSSKTHILTQISIIKSLFTWDTKFDWI